MFPRRRPQRCGCSTVPSDVPSLVSITPGGFDNIWVLDPKTKRLEEMQPIDPSLESAATLVRACGSRFWFRKVRRFPSEDAAAMWMMYRG